MKFRRPGGDQKEFFHYPWNDLATYNAEVARGIVHTEEYDEKMAEEQRRFDEAHARGAAS